VWRRKMARRKLGCILGPIITLIIVIAVIGIAAAVLLNMTPEKLGFADEPIFNGQSLRDMGLADVKIKDFFSLIKSLMKPNEGEIVKNAYNPEQESGNAKNAITAGGSNLQPDESGNVDYTLLLDTPLTYDNNYRIVYNDTTLAYIFDTMVQQTSGKAEEGLEFIKSINARINEVSITGFGNNAKLRIVMSSDIGMFSKEIKDKLGAAGSFISIPVKIFIVCYYDMGAGSDGKVTLEGVSIKINDTDNLVADAIFAFLASKADVESGAGRDIVSQKIAEAFTIIVGNLGDVGEAEANAQGVVTGAITLGPSGIAEHKIVIITKTSI